MSLVIVGSMAFDTIHTMNESRERVIGGACTYAALAASYFTKPGIIGVIGDDFTEKHLDILRSKGINTDGVIREKGKSFFWEGRYHEDMNNRDTIKTELNVFEKFDPVIPAHYADKPFLFLANIDPPLQLKVLKAMKKLKFSVCDTMNLWINIKKDELTEVFKRVDCVVLNDSEIRQYSGEQSIHKAAGHIRKIGPKYVIVKKGEHGAVILGPKGFYFAVPSFPVTSLVDPTGAGDSFAGAFTGYLAKSGRVNEKNLRAAMFYATAAASYTVQGFSIESLATAGNKGIQKRFNELKKITSL